MKCKAAKKMIESITPEPKKDSYMPFNVFPWDRDFMCPYNDFEMQKSKRILLKIKKRFNSKLVKEIKSILDYCEANFVIGFVRCHEGSNESDLPDNHIGCYFIDEHENGGLSGDSYSGYGYIKVSKKDYLKFSYAM